MLAHWDEIESGRAEAGHIAGLWTDLGSAGTDCSYARSNRIYFRGPAPIARLEDLAYDDGESR